MNILLSLELLINKFSESI